MKVNVLNEYKLDTTLNNVRDLPDISNKIIYFQQLAQKLDFHQNRVREVLGDDWENQQEGTTLKRDCDNLKTRILKEQEKHYKMWHDYVKGIEFDKEKDKPVFIIEQRGKNYILSLNFNESLISLWKEYQNVI